MIGTCLFSIVYFQRYPYTIDTALQYATRLSVNPSSKRGPLDALMCMRAVASRAPIYAEEFCTEGQLLLALNKLRTRGELNYHVYFCDNIITWNTSRITGLCRGNAPVNFFKLTRISLKRDIWKFPTNSTV